MEPAMHPRRPNGFATRAIHIGYDPMAHEGALTPPLHLTSTFAFDSVEQGAAIFAGEKPGYFELLAKLSRYDRLAACQARAVRASAAVCELDLVVPVIFRRI